MKKTLEEIECVSHNLIPYSFLTRFSSHIQGRIQISKELHQRKLGEEATKGQDMIRTVHKVGTSSFYTHFFYIRILIRN